MGLKPKLRVGWRQLISAASGALSGMFLVTPALSGERAVYVRDRDARRLNIGCAVENDC